MKLTGWFSQDKIADNSRVQTPNNANTEQVNRQIRALVPGQTLRGEVVSREGNNAQIRLLQDVLVDAKVDADIRLELGQNITFQVKNNGQTLNLSPLFTNMATEGTVLKALDMASLPVNENTVAMTKQLMDAGLPIDKNTLQQIWHESNAFPDAEILDLVNLHRVELPVTEENITQMASYRNLTHQLTAGIAETGESLTNMLQGLVESGDIEQAATIYSEVLELLAFEDADGETVTGQQQTEGPLPEPGVDVTVTPEEAEQMPVQSSATAPEAVPGQKTIIEEPTETASGNGQTIKENPGAEKTQEAPQLQNLQKLLKQGLETKDIPLLRSILHNSKVAELPAKLLADRWSIKPEDVESPEKVEELYQKLGKQLKGLSNLLEENGQRGSSAYQNVTNLSQNVDFLQQINQTYAYIQLPLHLRQGEHKTGELFVYTNKKNLARKDGQVSALLHLDMEHLGPLDVYVTLKDTKVSTKFYVQNDAILDYLEANMDVLTERLQKRGYDCKCETTLRTELQQTAQAMAPLLKTEGCKYGYGIKKGDMSLTLIKSGTYPNEDADIGEHRFTYSIYPHAGRWQEAKTVEMAYNLNVPMPVKRIGKQKGCGEEYDSFLHCDKESCFIEVIKKAEDGDGVIVRMYENKNNRVRAHITSGRALAHVYECNLLEEKEAELTVCGTTFETVFKPYEIKTFRLIFA